MWSTRCSPRKSIRQESKLIILLHATRDNFLNRRFIAYQNLHYNLLQSERQKKTEFQHTSVPWESYRTSDQDISVIGPEIVLNVSMYGTLYPHLICEEFSVMGSQSLYNINIYK